MAFDKVVDSAVLESGLTSIANAIREKGGTADALAFPAGFAEAIAAIESGGDLCELFGAKATTGSFTLAEDTISDFTVNFGGVFSEYPYYFFAFEEAGASGGVVSRFVAQATVTKKPNDAYFSSGLGTQTDTWITDSTKKFKSSTYGWDKNTTKDSVDIHFSENRIGKAGTKIYWIAIGE